MPGRVAAVILAAVWRTNFGKIGDANPAGQLQRTIK
jgi:hypothetical protein